MEGGTKIHDFPLMLTHSNVLQETMMLIWTAIGIAVSAGRETQLPTIIGSFCDENLDQTIAKDGHVVSSLNYSIVRVHGLLYLMLTPLT